jgi:hypothetical protein
VMISDFARIGCRSLNALMIGWSCLEMLKLPPQC